MYDRGTDPATSRASNDAQSTLKQHVYQIRLLTSDNQIKTQQLDILKEKVKELEDVNAIYQKQIANMETKLKYYDQEIKLKYQSSEEKSVKLTQNNQYLYKKNQQLQARVKELEDKIRSYEQEITMNSADADHLRRKLAEAEEQLEKSRDKKKRKTYEMDRLSETNQQMSAENQDLNRTISHLKQDNDRLLRTIEENEHQLKKFSLVQQQYQDLKSMHENEFAESRALKQSYDLLKQKYDEVYYNYNISLLNKQNDESDTETNRAKVMELEQELDHLDAILRRKDKEITHLTETVRDLDHQLKDKDIRYETEIKQIVNLIDGQTTNFDYGSQEESVAIRLLVDNILRQNREFVRISDKTKMSAQDGKEMKVNLNRLNEEKNNLKNEIEDLQKENESLRMRLQSTINDSLHNINLAQTSFEERLNEMVNIQKEAEERYNEQLQQKDGEVAYFQELLNAAEEKVRKVEDDRDRTVEFLREQEMEIKEFKMKFFQIAEETSHQKNRLNVTAYVLSSFLKIFFNLIAKFDGLVQQKSFLSPYFYQYEKIKDKLTEMQLIHPRAESQRESSGIYQRFRKVVITVMAALRLRKLQLRNGGIKYDTFDVRHNLTNCSEGLKRFIIDLFRGSKFVINRDLVTSVDDILRNFESQSEDAIVSKIIVAASQYNDIPYEPELTVRRKRTRDLQLEDLTSNFRLKDDFDYRLQALDGKLRLAEEHILKQEDKFREELGELTDKLREVRLENETYKREKDRIHTDYHMAKEQIDTLLVLVDEKQSIMPEYLRRNRNLNEDYNILQDYVVSLVRKYDIARKELEEKDLRMVELERQLIQAGNEENLMMVHSTPINNVPRDKTPKVAGRIVSSGRKRNFNELQ